jgi:putative NADPH-quinone reductase
MAESVLFFSGYPDFAPEQFCAALAATDGEGPTAAGPEVRTIFVGWLDFPLIRSAAQFLDRALRPQFTAAQESVRWAQHLVIAHPRWHGAAPARLVGLFEQVFCRGLALPQRAGGFSHGLLAGRSASVIVRRDLPAIVYRIALGAHGMRALERGVFALSGIKSLPHMLIGGLDGTARRRARWLARVRTLGGEAA